MAKLADYKAKRDFQKTSEPSGEDEAAAGSAFVVQKHDATRLHYDLRLELDGVMKSWAVAKGPSLVAGEKRLAVHVEDHPIAYNTFEGTIPKGQYGGGTVMVWDSGRWTPEGDPHKGYKKGHLDFTLAGEKLGGRWHLVRMRKKPREKQEAWLLIKSEDTFARAPDEPDIQDSAPRSVASGRTMEQIAGDPKGAVWDSNRGDAAEARQAKSARRPRKAPAATEPQDRDPPDVAGNADGPPSPIEDLAQGGRAGPMPKAVEPCLATLVAKVPNGAGWLHEIKWDGYRLIVFKSGGRVRIATRRGHDWTTRFPAIAEAVAALPVDTLVLDGEAIVEDENGVANFSALQNALSDEHGRVASNAILFAFDLLYLEGSDLRALPLDERKARLEALVSAGRADALRLSEHVVGDGETMARSACQLGLEGVISKRRDRPYRSGRGEDWLKTKCTQRQEFVIGGFVPSKAGARAVGSLVLGYHEDGELKHAGRAGTGFTAESARLVWRQLDAIRRTASPFYRRLSAEERRGAVWAEPKLVAEIEFRGWTGDQHLRHAAFKGLRDDKAPEEVVRERPAAARDVDAAAEAAPAEKTSSSESGSPKSGAPKSGASKSGASKPQRGRDVGEVAGERLTHPDRVLWEDAGVTKADLAAYYERIADWILPHLVDRPLSLVRCPSGSDKGCFFQKHSWAGLSESIRREMVRDESGEEEILFVEEVRGLVGLVQAGVLEIHPWGATVEDVERPDRIVIDLDPGEGVGWSQVVEAAREVRARLEADGLTSFVKTTGGKGLHVVFPITRGAGWAAVKGYAKALADGMEREAPDRFIAKSSKAARRGLIYVDYLRNGRGATAIAPYSSRARPGAPVAVPLRWDELTPKLDRPHFTVKTLPERLKRLRSDPWAELAGLEQRLPALPAGRSPRRTPKPTVTDR